MKTTPLNIPQGYQQTPVGIIPIDWEVKRLGELGKFYKGKGIAKTDLIDDGLKAIRYGELYTTHNIYIKDYISFIDDATSKKSFLLHKGDLLFAGSGETIEEIGKCVALLNDDKVYAGGDIIVLRPKEKVNSCFLGFLNNADVYKRQAYKMGQGNAVVHIYPSNLSKIQLPIPPLAEQEKIANCLTTWDTAIEKLSALIAAKKQRKKGLMQQLLTGKKRLNGFSDEWKKVRLGKLGTTFNGLTGKTKDDFGEGKPYVTYLNVFNNGKIDDSLNFDYVDVGDDEKQNDLRFGDLIFTTSSETPNEVGMSGVILFQPKESLYLNSFCFGLRLNNFTILKPEFAVFILRSQNFRREMYKLAQGSTRFNLSKTGFKKIKLILPPLEEQTAIAEVLSTADKEIRLLEEKLVSLNQQKKGLMQVLLTGKKRIVN